jgi:hypothetical protein
VFIGVVLVALGIAAYYWWRRSGHPAATDIAVNTIEKVAEKGIHLPLPHRSAESNAAKDAAAQ